jgi:DNA-binding HxlR family transcriptional regulator
MQLWRIQDILGNSYRSSRTALEDDTPADKHGPPSPYLLFTRPKGSIGCPIRASMGVLGHKWALIILRDVAFLPAPTFSLIQHRNPGLTPRVLTERLKELRAARLVEKVGHPSDERIFYYRLTDRGRDTIPVLTAMMQFGMKHLAEKVYEDGRSRTMKESFPGLADRFLGELFDYAVSDFKSGARPPEGILLTPATAPRSGVAVRTSPVRSMGKRRKSKGFEVRPFPTPL